MMKTSGLARGCILLYITIILLISYQANSERLEMFLQNNQSLKLSSNELIYDSSINGYVLLGSVLIKYGSINIKSDSLVIYKNDSDLNNSIVAENTLNKIFSKFYIFNQYKIVIESKRIEYNDTKNEIKITDAFIKNMDDKTTFYYIIAPIIIINTKNGEFKAYTADNNKVRVMIPSVLNFKKFKPSE